MAMPVSRKRAGNNASEATELAKGVSCTRLELAADGTKLLLRDKDGKVLVARRKSGKWGDESKRKRVQVPLRMLQPAAVTSHEWRPWFHIYILWKQGSGMGVGVRTAVGTGVGMWMGV